MAMYNPDLKYIEAKEIVDNLSDSAKDKAIKYYIFKHQEWHNKDKKELEGFRKFFTQLGSYLPKTGRKIN